MLARLIIPGEIIVLNCWEVRPGDLRPTKSAPLHFSRIKTALFELGSEPEPEPEWFIRGESAGGCGFGWSYHTHVDRSRALCIRIILYNPIHSDGEEEGRKGKRVEGAAGEKYLALPPHRGRPISWEYADGGGEAGCSWPL